MLLSCWVWWGSMIIKLCRLIQPWLFLPIRCFLTENSWNHSPKDCVYCLFVIVNTFVCKNNLWRASLCDSTTTSSYKNCLLDYVILFSWRRFWWSILTLFHNLVWMITPGRYYVVTFMIITYSRKLNFPFTKVLDVAPSFAIIICITRPT